MGKQNRFAFPMEPETFVRTLVLFAHLLGAAGFILVSTVGRVRFMSFYLVLLASLIIFDILFFRVSKFPLQNRVDKHQETVQVCLFNKRMGLISSLLSLSILLITGQGWAFLISVSLSFTVGVGIAFKYTNQTRKSIGLVTILTSSFLLMASEATKGALYSDTGDPIHHLATINNILQSHYLTGVARPRRMPYLFFHTGASEVANVTGLEARMATLLFIAICIQLAILSIYLFVRNLIDYKVAAIAAVVLATLPTVVISGSIAHYRSLSFVFLVFFIYLVVARPHQRIGIVLTIVILAWILTHHVSIVLASLFLTMLALTGFRYYRQTTSISFILILGVVFTYYYVTTDTVVELLVWLFFTSPSAEGAAATGYQVEYYANLIEFIIAAIPTFLNYIFYVPLLSIGGYGLCRLWIQRSPTEDIISVILLSLPAIIVFVPNPAWILLEGVAEIPRWQLIAAPFFVIPIAYGIKEVVSKKGSSSATSNFHIVIFIVIVLLVFSAPNNGDLVDMAGFEKEPQRYITNEEMAMLDHTIEYPTSGKIYSYSDLPLYLSKYGTYPSQDVEIGQLQANQSQIQANNVTILISNKTLHTNAVGLEKCNIITGSEVCSLYVASHQNYTPNFQKSQKIYSNGGGEIYRSVGK
jgi:hypothetical protein